MRFNYIFSFNIVDENGECFCFAVVGAERCKPYCLCRPAQYVLDEPLMIILDFNCGYMAFVAVIPVGKSVTENAELLIRCTESENYYRFAFTAIPEDDNEEREVV